MIEISFGKLVLLALIALIVLGPEKLPGAARTAGALLRRMRSGWDNVRAEVERELQIEEIKRTAREAAARAEAAQAELDAAVQKVRNVGNDIPPHDSTGSDVGEPAAIMLPLGDARYAESAQAVVEHDVDTGNRDGELLTPLKSSAESPHGHP